MTSPSQGREGGVPLPCGQREEALLSALHGRPAATGKKNLQYHYYPPGTMIIVKDNRPRPPKKMFPLYDNCPEMVVSEYKCTVFSKNFLGQGSKHSKNNIKLASQRNIKLFEQLPDGIKIVIASPFNPNSTGRGQSRPRQL